MFELFFDMLRILPIATGLEVAALATLLAGTVATAIITRPKKQAPVARPKAPALPEAPDPEAIRKKETKKIRRGAITDQTIATSARGVLTKAPVTRKTLLGE